MPARERTQRSGPSGTIAPAKDVNDTVTLRLEDFLDQLPKPLLATTPLDGDQPISFRLAEIAKHFIEKRTTIELVKIYRQVPRAFAHEIKASDTHQVPFPWSKLIELVLAASPSNPDSGLTHAAALHLARLLRGFRSSTPAKGQSASVEGEQILQELAATIEQFGNPKALEKKAPEEQIETSDAMALTDEENDRLRKEIEERDREIESLRRTLAELESAAIDQIAAFNEQFEEYETAKVKAVPTSDDGVPLNPQQTAMLESLSQQVTELYIELDRARDDALQATAAHARYRELQESSGNSNPIHQYLSSVGQELERAHALLKEMETKALQTEAIIANKDSETQRLMEEMDFLKRRFADVCIERDALRGRLYATSSQPGGNA